MYNINLVRYALLNQFLVQASPIDNKFDFWYEKKILGEFGWVPYNEQLLWVEVMNIERKNKETKMEVISEKDYLKIHYGDRHYYFRLDESKLKPMKFSIGDVIHTIDYHYLEDGNGNDISQDIMFVNPNVITGKYKITGFAEDELDDYNCITILDAFGDSGSTAYVGKDVIFENYKNSNLIPNVK